MITPTTLSTWRIVQPIVSAPMVTSIADDGRNAEKSLKVMWLKTKRFHRGSGVKVGTRQTEPRSRKLVRATSSNGFVVTVGGFFFVWLISGIVTDHLASAIALDLAKIASTDRCIAVPDS